MSLRGFLWKAFSLISRESFNGAMEGVAICPTAESETCPPDELDSRWLIEGSLSVIKEGTKHCIVGNAYKDCNNVQVTTERLQKGVHICAIEYGTNEKVLSLKVNDVTSVNYDCDNFEVRFVDGQTKVEYFMKLKKEGDAESFFELLRDAENLSGGCAGSEESEGTSVDPSPTGEEEPMDVDDDYDVNIAAQLLHDFQLAIHEGDVGKTESIARELAQKKSRICVVLDDIRAKHQHKKRRIIVNVETLGRDARLFEIDLVISLGMTLFALKVKVAVLYNIPIESQRWIVGKRFLRDHNPLQEQDINSSRCKIFLLVLQPPASMHEFIWTTQNAVWECYETMLSNKQDTDFMFTSIVFQTLLTEKYGRDYLERYERQLDAWMKEAYHQIEEKMKRKAVMPDARGDHLPQRRLVSHQQIMKSPNPGNKENTDVLPFQLPSQTQLKEKISLQANVPKIIQQPLREKPHFLIAPHKIQKQNDLDFPPSEQPIRGEPVERIYGRDLTASKLSKSHKRNRSNKSPPEHSERFKTSVEKSPKQSKVSEPLSKMLRPAYIAAFRNAPEDVMFDETTDLFHQPAENSSLPTKARKNPARAKKYQTEMFQRKAGPESIFKIPNLKECSLKKEKPGRSSMQTFPVIPKPLPGYQNEQGPDHSAEMLKNGQIRKDQHSQNTCALYEMAPFVDRRERGPEKIIRQKDLGSVDSKRTFMSLKQQANTAFDDFVQPQAVMKPSSKSPHVRLSGHFAPFSQPQDTVWTWGRPPHKGHDFDLGQLDATIEADGHEPIRKDDSHSSLGCNQIWKSPSNVHPVHEAYSINGRYSKRNKGHHGDNFDQPLSDDLDETDNYTLVTIGSQEIQTDDLAPSRIGRADALPLRILPKASEVGWSCPSCTRRNPPRIPGCRTCYADRPANYKVPPVGSYVMDGGEQEKYEEEKKSLFLLKKLKEREAVQKRQEQYVNYQYYIEAFVQNLVFTKAEFECPICLTPIEVGHGACLRECLHEVCLECLRQHILHSETAVITCPYVDENNVKCQQMVLEQEIRELVSEEELAAHLQKSLNQAEAADPNTFHCLTPNCTGFCFFANEGAMFQCPVCRELNCLNCQAIHRNQNCGQYQDSLLAKDNARVERESEAAIDRMVADGEAMRCPYCRIYIRKRGGCPNMTCSMCGTIFKWTGRQDL